MTIIQTIGLTFLLLPTCIIGYQYLQICETPMLLVATILAGVFFIVGLVSKLNRTPKQVKLSAISCLLGIAGALSTYMLSINLGLGPFIASGITGLIAGYTLKEERATLAYAAIFIGMSSSETIGYLGICLAGMLIGVVYELTSKQWQGIGGKLGTLAAGSVIIVRLFYL